MSVDAPTTEAKMKAKETKMKFMEADAKIKLLEVEAKLMAKENKIMLTNLESITDLDRMEWFQMRQKMVRVHEA
jgi:hypothetical protein